MQPLPLPPGIRQRFVEGVNGLTMHLLEAGFESPGRPALLLLHGFPEIAYSWRKIMPGLAEAGFHVIAPDQRGYGRTTGWDDAYDGDVNSFRISNVVRDQVSLLAHLGVNHVRAVIGHDFGAPVAAWCALIRPDLFGAVALMSAPFAGTPKLPQPRTVDTVLADLAALKRPRKHYQWYYSTRTANADMRHAPQGLHAFLRAYYHYKSADWPGNKPAPLAAWSASELARLPTYYIMDQALDMAATVAAEMPGPAQIAGCQWLPDAELRVYAEEYTRTGFQGGLQWYRCGTEGRNADLELFAGRRIDIPACFISGTADWGVYQKPGDYQRMQTTACTDMRVCRLLEGAGHWVQQEQPDAVLATLLNFLQG
jgi:pimeloyl-ACP methyl ester carboxylesterase